MTGSQERITRAQCASVLESLATVCGATMADPSWPITDARRDGAWFLDYASCYGGYVVRAYAASSPVEHRPQTYTAESEPLWMERCNARQFFDRCVAGIKVAQFMKWNAS